jgi:hypothetical protein
MSERTLILRMAATIEGQSEPEIETTIRVKWPDDQTLGELFEAEAKRYCQQLRARKYEWSTA